MGATYRTRQCNMGTTALWCSRKSWVQGNVRVIKDSELRMIIIAMKRGGFVLKITLNEN